MLTSPNLSYTSRDFKSIYEDLLSSISLLTNSWEANNDNDPGVVLLKAISMVGDMLSYNQDKQALEELKQQMSNINLILESIIGNGVNDTLESIINS